MDNKYEKSSVTPGQKCEIIKSKEARRRDLQTHRRILKMEQKKPKTMFEKIWDAHVVREVPGESTILYIDRHLVHEMTSPQAFAGLRLAGRKVHRPTATIAVVDHMIPTAVGRKRLDVVDQESTLCITTMEQNARDFQLTLFDMNDERQGIVHIIGPEQGISLPGMTIV